MLHPSESPTLFFHSPCFDGIVSAVITVDFLEQHEGWSSLELEHVNYDLREEWLETTLPRRSAVVDFLYHPAATFWADHHLSTFLNHAVHADYERRLDHYVFYDNRADSCAGLLWRALLRRFAYRNPRWADLVRWAEKIDAARYDSVEEATSFRAPALGISATLSRGDASYCEWLVRMLSQLTLDEVSQLAPVREKLATVEQLASEGMDRLGRAIRLDGEIVIFDVDTHGVFVSRYAPYRFYPAARYSIGILRSAHGAKITAMRNPWLNFESVPLGEIFARHGGGGHQRVGSVFLSVERQAGAGELLRELSSQIRTADERQLTTTQQ